MDNRLPAVEKNALVSMIRQSARPLEAHLPALSPNLEALLAAKLPAKPKAVLFDVYGTLFCSAAGDISLLADAAGETNEALKALAGEYGIGPSAMRAFFKDQVVASHKLAQGENQYPEVKVEEIWARFLARGGDAGGFEAARELALRYELAANPVVPMPGALETIKALAQAGIPLGIISNAQFFTPLLFEAFFGAPAEALGFDPELLIWSFEHGAAKPSPLLFEKAALALAARGIAPAQCLFVGNDMLSDILGASNSGFKGVLFAGDSRSLRLREGDARLSGASPDLVIRALGDVCRQF